MRLIDADAFKNYIQSGLEDVRYFFKDNGKRAEKVIEGICEDIDEQPTIELPKWIPCSERLPKENECVGNVWKYYLIQDEYEDMHVAHLSSRGWETIESFKALECDVVAWMPLPEPYKRGDDHEISYGGFITTHDMLDFGYESVDDLAEDFAECLKNNMRGDTND